MTGPSARSLSTSASTRTSDRAGSESTLIAEGDCAAAAMTKAATVVARALTDIRIAPREFLIFWTLESHCDLYNGMHGQPDPAPNTIDRLAVLLMRTIIVRIRSVK